MQQVSISEQGFMWFYIAILLVFYILGSTYFEIEKDKINITKIVESNCSYTIGSIWIHFSISLINLIVMIIICLFRDIIICKYKSLILSNNCNSDNTMLIKRLWITSRICCLITLILYTPTCFINASVWKTNCSKYYSNTELPLIFWLNGTIIIIYWIYVITFSIFECIFCCKNKKEYEKPLVIKV